MPETFPAQERTGEILNWSVGREFQIRYPLSEAKPITYVFGRNPNTTERRQRDLTDSDEIAVKLAGVGSSVSRRALKLTLYPDRMTVTNLGSYELRWNRPSMSQEVVVNPDETLSIPYTGDFRETAIPVRFKFATAGRVEFENYRLAGSQVVYGSGAGV